jgi:hypothetical protein
MGLGLSLGLTGRGQGRGFDLYVDSVNGSDANSGKSPSSAKQTLAAITWRAGLRVGLARGSVFRGMVTLSSPGCTLGAYGSGAKPVLIGSTAITSGWTLVSGNVWSQTLAAAPANLLQRTAYSTAGLTKLTQNTATPTTPGAGEWGYSTGTLYVNSATDPNTLAYENAAFDSVNNNLVLVTAGGCALEDLALLCAQRNGFYVTGAFAGFAARRCELSYNSNDGGGGQPSGGDLTSCLVESCTVWGNGNGPKDGTGSDGDGLSWHGNGTTAHSEVTIRYCDIRNNTKSGIGHQSATICTAYGNWLEANFNNVAIFTTTYTGSTPIVSTYAYNVMVRPAGEQDGVNTNTGGAAPSHAFTIKLYNNSIYSKGTDNFRNGVAVVDSSFITLVMRNNIVKGWARGLRSFSGATLDLDYNDVQGNTTNYFDNSTGYLTGKTGAHSITGDPLFTNAAGSDFTLQAGSPCLNAGVDLGYAQDYARNPVPFGAAPDIGAYERQN